ncbi:hypothetical protein ABW19_dt0201585 [Dactylella cylindrospora]|nr:hypothetical protein ABW19_dt0201585 [Dactylella cylindrospora]
MRSDAEPVADERQFIAPYDILDKMKILQSVTIYVDCKISPNEISNLIRYLLKTKERLTRLTIDIAELQSPLPCYDSRVIYDLKHSIRALTPHGGNLPGAKLNRLSICIKNPAAPWLLEDIRNAFPGHCDTLQYLRYVKEPTEDNEIWDLSPWTSRKLEECSYVIPRFAPDLYQPVLSITRKPEEITALTMYILLHPQVLLTYMTNTTTSFPFPNLRSIRMIIVPKQRYSHPLFGITEDLRNQWQGLTQALLVKNPNIRDAFLAEYQPKGVMNIMYIERDPVTDEIRAHRI